LLDHCVKGATIGALDAEKVPLSIGRFGFAIVTHDVHDALQVGRHGVFRNISGTRFPCRCHGLLRYDSLFANWAPIIKAGEFAEAVCMDGVSTREILRRLTRRKHVLTAYRAIVLVFVLEALMGSKHRGRNAHAAFTAMAERFDTAHSTKTTLLTMERLFSLLFLKKSNGNK
jgi:hypothetical protein